MKHIYLSARQGRRAELQHHQATLEYLGWHVTSRWLLPEHDATPDAGMGAPDVAAAQQLARMALIDILASDTLIAFTEAPDSPYGRGGRNVELGMALILRHLGFLQRVVVIGPMENVFGALADEHYETLLDGLAVWVADQRTEDTV